MRTFAKVALFAVAVSLVLWLLPLRSAGAEVVSQGDKCSGKNCRVISLTGSSFEAIGPGGISTDGGFTCGTSGTPCTISSPISAATASTTVPSVVITSAVALDATDLLLDVQSSNGTSRFRVNGQSTVLTDGQFRSNQAADSIGFYAPTGVIESDAASGHNGIALGTNGARIDFGAGASDYASSDGTTVTFAGPLSSAGIVGSTSGEFKGNAAGSSFFEGNANHASGTTATVPAAVVRATQALTAGDAVAGIQQSDGTNLLRCFQGGGCDIGAAPATVAGATIDTTSNHTNVWNSYCVQSPCTKAETAGDSFVMPLNNTGGTTARLQCNWHVAGTGGTTGVVVAIWNQTDSSELCSCAVQGCAVAIGTVGACTCSGTFNSAKAYVMRLKSTTDCTTVPGGIGCTLTYN